MDSLVVTLGSFGGSDDVAPPVIRSAADGSGIFEIPFEELALEPRPFARGGGGQVMYHDHERARARCAL